MPIDFNDEYAGERPSMPGVSPWQEYAACTLPTKGFIDA